MASPQENRPNARIRLLTSFWPRPKLGPSGVLLFAFAWVVGFALASTILVAPLIPFLNRMGANNWSRPLVLCAAVVVSTWGNFRLFNYVAASRLHEKRPCRWDRLQRLLEQPGAAARFPHRVAEHAFYKSPHFPMRHSKVVRMARPGQLILCNLVTPAWEEIPQPNDIPFEPIELEAESERSIEYLYASLRSQGIDGDRFMNEHKESCRKYKRQLTSAQQTRTVALVGLAVSVRYIFFGPGSSGVFVWYIALGIAISIALAPLFHVRKWWIVPGGLVCRESCLWRRKMKIYHITAKDTPLLLDERQTHGYVMHGQRVFKVPFAALWWWPIAAAWMSTATPPTMEQIRQFAGIEVTASNATGDKVAT